MGWDADSPFPILIFIYNIKYEDGVRRTIGKCKSHLIGHIWNLGETLQAQGCIYCGCVQKIPSVGARIKGP